MISSIFLFILLYSSIITNFIFLVRLLIQLTFSTGGGKGDKMQYSTYYESSLVLLVNSKMIDYSFLFLCIFGVRFST
jgi:hypothetical protein